jgi:hypothetical protein
LPGVPLWLGVVEDLHSINEGEDGYAGDHEYFGELSTI